MKRKVTWKSRIGALALGTVLAFLILEVALRIWNPFVSRVRGGRIVLPVDVVYEYEPAGDIRGLSERVVHTKNSLGFRGPEPPADRDEALTLLTIGGSTTECSFISDGGTWPALVAKELGARFSGLWLNNAGLDGHSTFGHRVLLRDYVLERVEPKVVVFLVGSNDMATEGLSAHVLDEVRSGIDFGSVEGFVKSLSAYSEVVHLSVTLYQWARARAAGLPHGNLDVRTDSPGPASRQEIEQAKTEHVERGYVDAFRRRLESLCSLSRENGIEPVLVTQPCLVGEGADPATGVALGVGTWRRLWQLLELYNDETRRVGREAGCLVIDLARKLPKDSRLFYDNLHFTDRGCEEVARIVAADLSVFLEAAFPDHVK